MIHIHFCLKLLIHFTWIKLYFSYSFANYGHLYGHKFPHFTTQDNSEAPGLQTWPIKVVWPSEPLTCEFSPCSVSNNLSVWYFLSCETGQCKHHRASHWACRSKPMTSSWHFKFDSSWSNTPIAEIPNRTGRCETFSNKGNTGRLLSQWNIL